MRYVIIFVAAFGWMAYGVCRLALSFVDFIPLADKVALSFIGALAGLIASTFFYLDELRDLPELLTKRK